MEKAGADSVAKVTGCDAEDLQNQVREHHEQSYGMKKDYKVRADPTGKKGAVDFSQMGSSAKTEAFDMI
jgi:hypothetical protein